VTTHADATAEAISHPDDYGTVFHCRAPSTGFGFSARENRRDGERFPAMTTERQAVGAYGERVAAQHLQEQGLVVLHRNWRCPDGEIDLVLRDGNEVVFCEVKTRRGTGFGTPAEAVTQRKVRKLRVLAKRWLDETGIHPRTMRFDVVEVLPQRRGAPEVVHIRAAF
jgi:putative endonuclease